MTFKTAGKLSSLSKSRKLNTKGEIKREPKTVQKGPARNMVAEEAVAARPSSRRIGLLGAEIGKRGEMMTMGMMMNPASTSFRKPQRLCVLTGAPRCIPLAANLNSGRARLMQQSHQSMHGSH
jgi:hypothetical protein